MIKRIIMIKRTKKTLEFFIWELKIYSWPCTILHSKLNHVSSKMSRRRKWRIQEDYWDFLPNLANRFFHPGFIFFLYDMNYITRRIMTSIPFLICSSEKDNIVISTYSPSDWVKPLCIICVGLQYWTCGGQLIFFSQEWYFRPKQEKQ